MDERLTQKEWGWSSLEVRDPRCEVHRIDVKLGGYCSWHSHSFKHNVFSVAKGRLIIETQDPLFPNHPKQHILLPGDTITMAAGVRHRFRAPFEPVTAFEVYYPLSGRVVEPHDITRYGRGGIEP